MQDDLKGFLRDNADKKNLKELEENSREEVRAKITHDLQLMPNTIKALVDAFNVDDDAKRAGIELQLQGPKNTYNRTFFVLRLVYNADVDALLRKIGVLVLELRDASFFTVSRWSHMTIDAVTEHWKYAPNEQPKQLGSHRDYSVKQHGADYGWVTGNTDSATPVEFDVLFKGLLSRYLQNERI